MLTIIFLRSGDVNHHLAPRSGQRWCRRGHNLAPASRLESCTQVLGATPCVGASGCLPLGRHSDATARSWFWALSTEVACSKMTAFAALRITGIPAFRNACHHAETPRMVRFGDMTADAT